MKDILEIVKSAEEPGLLIEEAGESIQKEVNEQKGGFFRMLLGSLSANLVANMVPSKAKIPGQAVVLAGKGTITDGLHF